MTHTDTPPLNSVLLPQRACLRVTGADRFEFLQGLITNSTDTLRQGRALFTGLLTPQGKILFDFFVATDDDAQALLIDCAADRAADLLKRLGFYKLRAAVSLEDASEAFLVAAAWDTENEALLKSRNALVYRDPRLASMGVRAFISRNQAQDLSLIEDSLFTAHRVRWTIPESGRDYKLSDTFPHEACFDLLNGVDFKKGCYIGQEVVSRMQHRGTARTRILRVEGETALPDGGASITADGFEIGKLGSVAGASGLGLVRIDRAAKALGEQQKLDAGGVAVSLFVPAWANYTLELPPLETSIDGSA